MGRRANRRTHCSAFFVATRDATDDQSSPCLSIASSNVNVSWSVQSLASASSSGSSESESESPVRNRVRDVSLAVSSSAAPSPRVVETTRAKRAEDAPSGRLPAAKHATHVTSSSGFEAYAPASDTAGVAEVSAR